jgi:hypothetical protein
LPFNVRKKLLHFMWVSLWPIARHVTRQDSAGSPTVAKLIYGLKIMFMSVAS